MYNPVFIGAGVYLLNGRSNAMFNGICRFRMSVGLYKLSKAPCCPKIFYKQLKILNTRVINLS